MLTRSQKRLLKQSQKYRKKQKTESDSDSDSSNYNDEGYKVVKREGQLPLLYPGACRWSLGEGKRLCKPAGIPTHGNMLESILDQKDSD